MKAIPIVVMLTCVPVFAYAQKAPETGAYPIAGLNPSQRPAGAPVITQVEHGKDWESRFFHGISKPYPPNLGAAANWGNWYVPFDHPGMTGRYDIRKWHAPKGTTKQARGKQR